MSTLADIIKNADTIEHLTDNISVFTDDSTPAGTFAVATKIDGMSTTFLLRGEKGDLEATILGRIELDPKNTLRSNAYIGERLKGGNIIPSDVSKVLFHRMETGI